VGQDIIFIGSDAQVVIISAKIVMEEIVMIVISVHQPDIFLVVLVIVEMVILKTEGTSNVKF